MHNTATILMTASKKLRKYSFNQNVFTGERQFCSNPPEPWLGHPLTF
jgi:hypothetical protein